jgi:thymidylate synthase ThyX
MSTSLILISLTYIFELVLKNLKNKIKTNNYIYEVILQNNNNQISVNAYMDNVYPNKIDPKEFLYLTECERDFIVYNKLLDMGLLPQDARGKLPIDTATKCVYTYTIDEWRAIIDLRYYGTTGKPHPNAKIIAGLIRDKLIELGHEFRD